MIGYSRGASGFAAFSLGRLAGGSSFDFEGLL